MMWINQLNIKTKLCGFSSLASISLIKPHIISNVLNPASLSIIQLIQPRITAFNLA